ADPAALVALVLDPAVGEAVLCSHGELIGAVLERLVGHDLDDEVELAWPKGSTWVLAVEDGHLRQHRYLPPRPPHRARARWVGEDPGTVTLPIPNHTDGAGKTVTAANLAAGFAHAGRRTLA